MHLDFEQLAGSSRRQAVTIFAAITAVVLLTASRSLPAQSDTLGPYGKVVQSWIALRVSPGREAFAIERVRALSSDWMRGPLCSALITRGSGAPHRVVADPALAPQRPSAWRFGP